VALSSVASRRTTQPQLGLHCWPQARVDGFDWLRAAAAAAAVVVVVGPTVTVTLVSSADEIIGLLFDDDDDAIRTAAVVVRGCKRNLMADLVVCCLLSVV
jgi:hypothetical protein